MKKFPFAIASTAKNILEIANINYVLVIFMKEPVKFYKWKR